jgi:allantoin racemase
VNRILNIVPVPVPPEALDAFAAQIPDTVVHPGFENVFVAARAGGKTLASDY